MLGKLIKHEFKDTAKNFCAMYLIVLLIGVVLKVAIEIEVSFKIDNIILDIVSLIMVTAFVLGILAIMFGTIILILKRFYDNVVKDEGYLTFTLPVSTGKIIATKALVSYLWIIISGVAIVAMILLMLAGHGEVFTIIQKTIGETVDEINKAGLWSGVILLIFVILVSLYSYISVGYACFSVGQTWNKNKLLGAVITYVVIYFVTQIISVVAMVVIFGSNMTVLDDVVMVDKSFDYLMIFSLVLTVIKCVVCDIITHVVLRKKLNLQ
ncbi:hypothetical protein [uncultured Eubacterium sp.]|uniref:hypothetical protein n=1 Tax=uncultured Eubacterium sp. TaxID=165185 RepID=UPI00267278A2|nr:hypothetical protein [uncultured Eubacterium sp.]